MKKKRLLLIASLSLAVAVTLGVVVILLAPHASLTKANFDCVQNGMTQAEVEQIVGRGEFTGQGRIIVLYWGAVDKPATFVKLLDGCVVEKQWVDDNETFFGKICHWLHLI